MSAESVKGNVATTFEGACFLELVTATSTGALLLEMAVGGSETGTSVAAAAVVAEAASGVSATAEALTAAVVCASKLGGSYLSSFEGVCCAWLVSLTSSSSLSASKIRVRC
jgi:hypothetical protein